VVAEFRRRCAASRAQDAGGRKRFRDEVLREAGGLRYDHLEQEFGALARRLRWPVGATLKDLRHLFATAMNDAALPEAYRRYLLGHAPARAAVTAYTHLNELARHYTEAVRREWRPLVEAILRRLPEVTSKG
jgi:hypothetical protein